MLNYHGMIVVLPSDRPESVVRKAETSNKTFINAQFSNKTVMMRDPKGGCIPGKSVPNITSFPNRAQRRYDDRNYMKKNNNGIPKGFSKKEFGRYQNEFGSLKKAEEEKTND